MLRRTFLQASWLGGAWLVAGCTSRSSGSAPGPAVVVPGDARPRLASTLAADLAALEGDARLGVAVLDTGTGVVVGHRLDERFAMCSTFKAVLAAVVLERAAGGGPGLDTELALGASDLVHHAPVTGPLIEAATARGLPHARATIGELARAAQTTSDNPAANVLLRHLGGPEVLTTFCRRHGDPVTRFDRYEPAMNQWAADDPRDTTSPRATTTLLATLLYGGGLPAPARATLREWMIATETGAKRLRAELPAGWVAGDKTGTMVGDGQTTKINDVAWLEPPGGRAPLVVAAYLDTQVVADTTRPEEQAVLARVGRLVASAAA
ncbi:MAG: class A beta-lactamase [Kofleriaceae bacterium]